MCWEVTSSYLQIGIKKRIVGESDASAPKKERDLFGALRIDKWGWKREDRKKFQVLTRIVE